MTIVVIIVDLIAVDYSLVNVLNEVFAERSSIDGTTANWTLVNGAST